MATSGARAASAPRRPACRDTPCRPLARGGARGAFRRGPRPLGDRRSRTAPSPGSAHLPRGATGRNGSNSRFTTSRTVSRTAGGSAAWCWIFRSSFWAPRRASAARRSTSARSEAARWSAPRAAEPPGPRAPACSAGRTPPPEPARWPGSGAWPSRRDGPPRRPRTRADPGSPLRARPPPRRPTPLAPRPAAQMPLSRRQGSATR
jgi:hypothetical protein